MAMYDHVKYEAPCGNCGTLLTDWQSKDGPRNLLWLKPEDVKCFYTTCDSCGQKHEIKAETTAEERFNTVYGLWGKADAFKAEGAVAGSWSLVSPEDLAGDGEECEEDPIVLSLYIYGEHGLYREFDVDRDMIESGSLADDGTLTVTYYDKKPLRITPLFTKTTFGPK